MQIVLGIGTKTKHLWLLLLCFVTLCAMPNVASAQPKAEPDNIKIGYVNIRKIIAQAPQIQQIQKKLSTEFEKERQTIISLRNEITELSNAYDGVSVNKVDDSKSELQRLQKDIDEKQLELSKLQQRMREAYNLRRNEALAKLQTLVVDMVVKVSKEKQLDIVLNNTGVIYINKRIDITPDVFKYLSEQTID